MGVEKTDRRRGLHPCLFFGTPRALRAARPFAGRPDGRSTSRPHTQPHSRTPATHHLTISGKENGAAPAPPLPSLDDAAGVLKGLSLTTPHGAHDVAFYPKDRLVFRPTSAARGAAAASGRCRDLVVPVSAISAVAVLDAVPEDTAVYVLLRVAAAKLTAGAGDKPVPVLCARIPASASTSLTFAGATLTGNPAVVLCQALGKAGVPPSAFLAPDGAVFRGSKGGPSVRAAVRTDQGFAFPLRSALAFVKKPAMLLPTGALAAVELRRTEGGSSTFDAVLHFVAGAKAPDLQTPLELSSLPRDELPPLKAWLAACGVAMGAGDVDAPVRRGGGGDGAESGSSESEEEQGDDDDDSDSDADDDFDPDAVSMSSRDSDDSGTDEDDEEGGAGSGSDDKEGSPPAAKRMKTEDEDE